MRLPLLLAATLLAGTRLAMAQDTFPSRPIQILNPYTPGGATDVLARALAPGLSARLGQPVVVTNRDGAAGAIGTAAVSRAAADGHGLLFAPALVLSVLPQAQRGVEYRPDSLVPVCQTFDNVMVIAVRPDSPLRSLADLVAAARARPGGLNFGTLGVASIPHLAAVELSQAAGLDMVHVPFRGDAAVLTELSGGRLDFATLVLGSVAGRDLRVLAVFAEARHPSMPDVPTAREQGFDVAPTSFGGLFAPAGTPPARLVALEGACEAAARDETYRNVALSAYQPPGYYAGSAAFGARIARDVASKAALLRTLDLER
ncbi:Tripartite-type tricarboxylate transporter, receptor component TctC [Roseomonas rosea]|uniref:Tripartite-type tricarboxylate transporter, receptor component TctC n=1 Tax=Muricoccus roseus TaxID=198092 RepID=A0A1M6PTZ0_9PROT|nr:tripartite tricarboxylate transporter substrate binding protein [Roseomonas rosea]SHK11444.1 Tripartite-type tricarboxylate transporter, receptor component TctC [Roseomonas rosea]